MTPSPIYLSVGDVWEPNLYTLVFYRSFERHALQCREPSFSVENLNTVGRARTGRELIFSHLGVFILLAFSLARVIASIYRPHLGTLVLRMLLRT